MKRTQPPRQPQDKYIVRLPDGMRDRIAAAAEAAGRSMNAEIVHHLEAAFVLEEANTKLEEKVRQRTEQIGKALEQIEAAQDLLLKHNALLQKQVNELAKGKK